MKISVLGNIRRAFGLWGQACLVLLNNPVLLVLQIAVACLLTFFRMAPRQVLSFLSTANAHVIFLILMIGCLYFFSAFLSHYTIHYVQNQRVRYKESFFAGLHSYKQYFVYLLLFMPFIYLFLYESLGFVPYGQQLFFASLGIERFTQYINTSAARALLILLAVLLLFIFIMQHITSVVVWTGKSSPKEVAKLAFHLFRHNPVIIISLTCWLFFSGCLLLVFLRMAIFAIPDLLNLTIGYYIMTVSINLYCMSLTILYYDYYVKHDLESFKNDTQRTF